MNPAAPDVVVVGAGVAGCNTAWHLHQRGLRVTVVEARETAAAQATNGAAGFVASWSGFYLVGFGKTEWEMQQYGMDQLNTHHPASLYATFPPAEAKGLADKPEIHYTPKHGSSLNIAEIELSILARQCLDRRSPDVETLGQEVHAHQQSRDALGHKVKWRFTTDDARIKLKHLYPSIDP
jgi:hypothetical protein